MREFGETSHVLGLGKDRIYTPHVQVAVGCAGIVDRPAQRFIIKEVPASDGTAYPHGILEHHPTRAEVLMANFAIADGAIR